MAHLLLVVDSLDVGGAERHVVDLARALVSRGWSVAVGCSTSGSLAQDLRTAGVPVHVLGGVLVKRRTCARYAAALRALVLRIEPDFVHAHVHASEVAASRAVAGLGLPLVLTEHTEAPWRSRRDEAAASEALRNAHAVVAVSSAVARRVVQLGAPAHRVHRVVPAVPSAAVSPGAAVLDLPRPVVGFIGRLVPEKGVDVLLRAFAGLPDAVAGSLAVVGDGPERDRLEQEAHRIPRVHLLGRRRDARALLTQFDVLAVPSRSDGSPLVVAEASWAGTPVVATAVGGLPDRVEDGTDGLLVPPGDEAALRDALDRLLSDDELRSRLARARRARARCETHEAMVDRIEALYRRVLRATQSSSGAAASQSLCRTGVV